MVLCNHHALTIVYTILAPRLCPRGAKLATQSLLAVTETWAAMGTEQETGVNVRVSNPHADAKAVTPDRSRMCSGWFSKVAIAGLAPAIAVVLSTSTASFCAKTNEDYRQQYEVLMRAGDAAFRKSDFAEAARNYDEATNQCGYFDECDPRLAALNKLVQCYYAQGRMGEALKTWQSRIIFCLEKCKSSAAEKYQPLEMEAYRRTAQILRQFRRDGEAKGLELRADLLKLVPAEPASIFYSDSSKRKQKYIGFIDHQGRRIWSASIQPNSGGPAPVFSCSLAPTPDKTFIDLNGKTVLGPFDRIVSRFFENTAIVKKNDSGAKSSQAGMSSSDCIVIDTKGKQLGTLPLGIFAHDLRFSDGLACAHATDHRSGYFDLSGKWVIKPSFANAQDFSEGLAAATTDGKHWGYINKAGTFVIPPRFFSCGRFSGGIAAAWVERPSEKPEPDIELEFIDKEGSVLIGPISDVYRQGPGYIGASEPFSAGLAVLFRKGGCSYIDKQGKTVISQFAKIPPDCSATASSFSDGLAKIHMTRGGYGFYVGYIDKSGNWAIPPGFFDGYDFAEGVAPVSVNGYWGYIDKTGKFVIKPQYHHAYSFSEGRALVTWYE